MVTLSSEDGGAAYHRPVPEAGGRGASARDIHRRWNASSRRKVSGNEVLCRVVVGGILNDTKGVNIPGAEISLPTLSSKDAEDIRWGLEHQMDYIAVSFVRKRSDIMEVLKVMEDLGGSMKIIAKIETRQAVQNIVEIGDVVDGMMIARGDLGVEIATEEVPLQQKRIIDTAGQGKAVISHRCWTP